MPDVLTINQFKYYLVCLMEEIGEVLSEEEGSINHHNELADVASVVLMLRNHSVSFPISGILSGDTEVATHIIVMCEEPMANSALKLIQSRGDITSKNSLLLLHKFASKIYRFEIHNYVNEMRKAPIDRDLVRFVPMHVFFRLLGLWRDSEINPAKAEKINSLLRNYPA